MATEPTTSRPVGTVTGVSKTPASQDPRRVKDEHSESNHMVEGLSDNMKGFYTELTKIFPEIRVTSGLREDDHDSHHHTGDALDIGKEHTDVYDYLYNNQEGLALMNKYGLGILDETNPTTMQKTGATGPHFHIGKDSGLYKTTQTRYTQYDVAQPMQSWYSQNLNYDYSKPAEGQSVNTNLYGNHNPETGIVLEGTATEGKTGATFRLVVPTAQVASTFIGELDKEQEKEDYKVEKEKESQYRQALAQKQKEEQAKIDAVFSTMNKIHNRDEDSLTRKASETDYGITPVPQQGLEVQRNLPTLPSIFQI